MIVGIVPAKSQSTGLPGKNLREVGERPLLSYILETAGKTRYLDKVVVSTESPTIAAVAHQWGAETFEEPPEIATDPVPAEQAAKYTAGRLLEATVVVYLLATTPLLFPEDIDGCVELFQTQKPLSVAAVAEVWPAFYHYAINLTSKGHILWKDPQVPLRGMSRRQDLAQKERVYWPVGVWVIGRDTFLKHGSVNTQDMRGYIIPSERALDIHTEMDLAAAEFVLSQRTCSR